MKKGLVFNQYLASQLTGKSGGMLLNATGTYSETNGATIGTFNGQPVYAKIVNGHLAAYTYDTSGGPLTFKPGHWLLQAGLLTASEAANYAQTDPATGIFYASDVSGYTGSQLGKALSGGTTTTTTTNTSNTNTTTNTGSNLLSNLLGGSTTTGTTQTAAQKNTNMVVVVLIIAAVGFGVYYFAKKR